MNYLATLTNRVEIMFILIVLGFVLRKLNFLSDELQKELSVLMLKVITTLGVFNSFVTSYTAQKAKGVLYAILICIVAYTLSIVTANIFFKDENYSVENFALVMGNVGFFGLPIVSYVLGEEALMYGAVCNAFNGVIMWTYGEYILSRDKKMIKPLNGLKTPNMFFFLLGLVFFFLQIPLPNIFKQAITSLNNVNAPMCSLMIGAALVGTNFKDLKKDFSNLVCLVLRLLVIPIMMIFLMKFIPNTYEEVKLALLIVLSTPNASATPVFALRHHKDDDKAARLTCACSVLCVLTMPLVSSLALKVWGL